MDHTEFYFNHYKAKRNKAPNLRDPKFIGDFSLDDQRLFHSDKRNMRMFDEEILNEMVQFDLNKNVGKAIKKNMIETKKEKLNKILQWILQNKFKFETDESKKSGFTSLSTDFICYRGLLTELLCTPYDYREGWIIYATKFAGTIYLLAVETPEKEMQRSVETEQMKNMSSWGFKFEQYVTREDPNKAVNENEEYCCVLRSRLHEHSLVYGAEVDCASKTLYKTPHSDLSAFVELKTCRRLITEQNYRNFCRFRLRKWFAQSHLVGIPRIICGFRDDEGIVGALEPFNVKEILKLDMVDWSKDVMFNFLNDFLSWVKTRVAKDDPSFVYKFCCRPNQERITCEILGPTSENKFLPNFYIEEILK